MVSSDLIKEILKRKDMKGLMEKELIANLGRTKVTINKNSGYIFNLFQLLAQFKSKILIEELLKIADYPKEFLDKIFGEFVNYFEFTCLKIVKGNEKLFYEKILENENQITIAMISSLTKYYIKNKDKDVENYISDIARKGNKDEMYTAIKIMTIIESGYSKAEINLNAKRKNIKNLEVGIILENFASDRKKDKKKNKNIKIQNLSLLDIYSNIRNVGGDKNYLEKKELREMKLYEEELNKNKFDVEEWLWGL